MNRRFGLEFILYCFLLVGHHCIESSNAPILESSKVSLSSISKESYVQVADDVRLYTVEYGDFQSGSAPVVLLLHGFPDLSISWEYHALRLAEEGYFVVTPDMRGFGRSSIPEGKLDAYSQQRLVSDVDALRKHYCGENGSFTMLVGHDWGGVVAWATLEALGRSSSFGDTPSTAIARSAVLVNAPHPRTFSNKIYTIKQAVKSWYIFCFQLYWFPEFFLEHTQSLYYLNTKNEYQYLVESLEGSLVNNESSSCSTKTKTTPNEDSTCSANGNSLPMIGVERNLVIFKEALTDRASIHAMLSYYRAMTAGFWSNLRDPSELSLVNRLIRVLHNRGSDDGFLDSDGTTSGQQQELVVSIPTMILWGKKDPYLVEELASAPHGLLENFHGTKFLDAGHWVHWERPQEIAEELIHFANAHNNAMQQQESTMN